MAQRSFRLIVRMFVFFFFFAVQRRRNLRHQMAPLRMHRRARLLEFPWKQAANVVCVIYLLTQPFPRVVTWSLAWIVRQC